LTTWKITADTSLLVSSFVKDDETKVTLDRRAARIAEEKGIPARLLG